MIRGNHIHDVWDDPEGYLGCGIYPDEGSSGLLIEDNLVYRTSHGGLHVHFGRDNLVQNNFFAYGRDAQVHLGRGPNLSGKDQRKWYGRTNSSLIFERNVVLYDRGALFRRDSEFQGDSNVYWDASGVPQRFAGGRTFSAWQKLGRDVHSLLSDPRFIDPARGNFGLKPDSPLPGLGIRPLDPGRAGLVGDPAWRAKATALVRAKETVPARMGPPEDVIDENFEALRTGKQPRRARFYGEVQGASVRATAEAAASGKRSLLVTDAPGMINTYDPHFYWALKAEKGMARASFDLRLEAGAMGYHEWRDWSVTPYLAGPSLVFREDGKLVASSNELLTLPSGGWVHFDLVCALGDKADGTYAVTVTLPGKAPQCFPAIRYTPGFGKITWFGYSSEATNTTRFFLDNVNLECMNK